MKPVLDVTLGDTWARDLRLSLGKGDWRPVEKFLVATRQWEKRDFYVGVCAEWKGRPEWLDAWCDAAPQSSVPRLIRGAHSVRWAWEARGSSTADKVKGDAWPEFFSRLEAAERDLLKAAELDPQDPTPWSWLITTAIGRQQDVAARRARFAEAVRRDPLCASAHLRMLNGLTWKWGGSHDEMFAFAREAAARAPEGSGLHTLLCEAHIQRWLAFGMEQDEHGFKTHLRSDEATREIEGAWARSLGSPRSRPFLGGLGQHNVYAFCFWQQRQPQRARLELQATRGFVTETPWGYAGDPLTVFGEALQETSENPSLDKALAEKVRHYCAEAIQTAAKQFRFTLDYGDRGLLELEKLLATLAAQLPQLPKDQAQRAAVGIALEYGAYLGETLRRTLGGTWVSKVPGREDGDLAVRVGTTYLLPLSTVYRRVTQPLSQSVVQAFENWVETQLHPPPAPAPGAAAPQAPRGVAEDMRGFAESAVADSRKFLKQPLDYSEASLALLDEIVELVRRHAGSDPAERKRLLDVSSLKLGAYLGEVLRLQRGGIWLKDEPGLPPGMPVLGVGRDHAFTVPAVREFLEGHAVDMGGRSVARPSEYFSAVGARLRGWLDQALFGSAGSRDAVKRAMSDDLDLAEELLGYLESALLTASSRWGLQLDFSEKGLEGIEQVLGQLHDAAKASESKPPADTLRRAAIVWGTYVGEVLRRHLGGRWLNSEIPPQGPVLRLKIGNVEVYPLRKVEKRLLEGPGDAIPFYFQATRQIVQGKLGQ